MVEALPSSRAQLLTELSGLVQAFGAPVEVVGPAGIGKSHLVARLISNLEDVGQRVTRADLSETDDADDMVRIVSTALGATVALSCLDAGRAMAAELVDGPVTVLWLDGCDGVRHPLATVLRDLRSVRTLSIVLTAREPIGAEARDAHRLAPLEAKEAATLCVDLDPTDPVVQELTDLAGGSAHALAIFCGGVRAKGAASTLQAARTVRAGGGALSPLQLAIRVGWELMDEDLRTLLARCSLFRGGLTLDAAQALGAASSGTLHQLSGWGMLRDVVGSAGRSTVPDAVRQFMDGLPDRDVLLDDAPSRHTMYFLQRCDDLANRYHFCADRPAGDLLCAELGNLRTIAERELAVGTPSSTKLALRALVLRGMAAWEHRTADDAPLTERALARAGEHTIPPSLHAAAVLAGAWCKLSRGNVAGARRDARSAQRIAVGAGDEALTCQTMYLQATTRLGEPSPEVLELLDAAVGAAERAHSAYFAADCHSLAGLAAALRGEPERAGRSLSAATEGLEASGRFDRLLEGRTLERRGMLAYAAGDFDGCFDLCERALERLGPISYGAPEAATAQAYVAKVLQQRGQYAEAEHRLDVAVHRLRALELWPYLAHVLGHRGNLFHVRRDLDMARRDLAEAADLSKFMFAGAGAALVAQLAAVLADEGKLTAAQLELQRAGLVFGDRTARQYFPAAIIKLSEGHLHRAEAIRLEQQGEDPEPMLHAARRCLEEAAPDPAQAFFGWGARWALEAALASTSPELAKPPTASRDALVVMEAGRRFRPPQGEWVTLPAGSDAQRVLWQLCQQAPDTVAVTPAVLAALAGEAPAPTADPCPRLHLVLSRLRRLGLKDLIQRDRAGYFLDPSVTVLVS